MTSIVMYRAEIGGGLAKGWPKCVGGAKTIRRDGRCVRIEGGARADLARFGRAAEHSLGSGLGSDREWVGIDPESIQGTGEAVPVRL